MNFSTLASSKNKYSKSGFSRRKLVVAALARSGRSALLSVCMIRRGIFSVVIHRFLRESLLPRGTLVWQKNGPLLFGSFVARGPCSIPRHRATGDLLASQYRLLPGLSLRSRAGQFAAPQKSGCSRCQLVVDFAYAAHHRFSREQLCDSFPSSLAETSSHCPVGEYGPDRDR